MIESAPKIDEVRKLRAELGERVVRTPFIRCAGIEDAIGGNTEVHGKLEFLQRTGTFKARGALSVARSLTAEQLQAGVTAVSAGNHAIAVAYAARETGTNARVVMTRSANPSRVAACKLYGAEVVLADDVHVAFEVAEKIQRDEGRYFIHPFDGRTIAMGTGTVGLEMCEQYPDFDVLLVSVGGGGLIGGIANAVKQLKPDCEIIGIEPEGADTMQRSIAAGKPCGVEKVQTIADSLGAPYAMPYSFELCRRNVDRFVSVTDSSLRRAMGFLYSHMQIAVEPACAATTAALLGPLRQELQGKRVASVFCGSNIDWATFAAQVCFDE